MESIRVIGPFTDGLEFLDNLLRKVDKSNNTTLLQELHLKTGVEIDSMNVEVFYRKSLAENKDSLTNHSVTLNIETANNYVINYNMITKIIVTDTNENSIINQLSTETNGEDTNTHINENDTDFILSKEKYKQLDKSVYKWKQGLKTEIEKSQLQLVQVLSDSIGQKVEITKDHRVGTLRYVGKIKESKTDKFYCGVEFDTPIGKNNGCYQNDTNCKYFGPVAENHGLFVSPTAIQIITNQNNDDTLSSSIAEDNGLEEL